MSMCGLSLPRKALSRILVGYGCGLTKRPDVVPGPKSARRIEVTCGGGVTEVPHSALLPIGWSTFTPLRVGTVFKAACADAFRGEFRRRLKELVYREIVPDLRAAGSSGACDRDQSSTQQSETVPVPQC